MGQFDSLEDARRFFAGDRFATGSGMTLDWKALAGICFPRPWLLAGGIGPDNAARAAGICRPDGVDLNSRLETSPGRKDTGLLEKTVLALRGGEKHAGMQP